MVERWQKIMSHVAFVQSNLDEARWFSYNFFKVLVILA